MADSKWVIADRRYQMLDFFTATTIILILIKFFLWTMDYGLWTI